MPITPFSNGGGIFQGMTNGTRPSHIPPPAAATVPNRAERPGGPPPVGTPPPTTPVPPPAGVTPPGYNPGPRNLRDDANAPWMRQALRYVMAEHGGGNPGDAGNYEGSVAPGLWDDMEEIYSDNPDWDKGINEQYITRDWKGDGEGQHAQSVRFRPRQGSFLERLNNTHQGALAFGEDLPGQDPNSHRIDWSKLPQTRFGPANKVMAVTDDMMGKLLRPELVYDDPNYGRITPIMNYQSGNDWMKNIPMMIASAGFGQLGTIPAMMQQAIRAAQGIGQGRTPWGMIANLGASAAGIEIPSWAKPFTNMAISQMTKNNNNGGG